MDASNDDAAIAEFHAAARRRNVRIYAIGAAVCILIGVVIEIVAVTAGSTIDGSIHNGFSQGRAYGQAVKIVIAGGAFIVAGIGMAISAWKTRKRLA